MSAAVGTTDIPDRIAVAGIRREGARASLRLEFELDATTGRTVLAASRQEAPLRVVRAFAVEDGAALVHLHNVSGGLLGDDNLTLSFRVGPGANVQITTTGATRIYRPRAGAANTMQTNEVVVGENALLEYLPDAVIPFAGARFAQRTAIRLEAGAGLFWWEVLAPGREARGETFEYISVDLKMDLVAAGKLAAAERVRLEPGKRKLGLLARMETYRTWASFYLCRVGMESAAWVRLEAMLRELISVWNQDGETLWGVSTLAMHGLVVRCAARRSLNVARGLQEIWQRAKNELYGRDAVAPRKVN
jgi:urease accessory protein